MLDTANLAYYSYQSALRGIFTVNMQPPDNPGVLAIVMMFVVAFCWIISAQHCKRFNKKLDRREEELEMAALQLPNTQCTLIPIPHEERPSLERLYKELPVESQIA
jgi:hypothetical protein